MKQVLPTVWNLTHLFKGDNDPGILVYRLRFEKENHTFINKWKERTDYLKNPAILAEALNEYEKLQREYGTNNRELYYFSLRTSQDQNNPNLKAKFNKARETAIKVENDIQFFTLNIAKIPAKEQSKFLKDLALLPYKHFLEGLFENAKYLLTDPEEKILNLKSQTSYSNWVRMLSDFLSREERLVLDENGKKVKKGLSQIMSLMNNKNKKIRDSAAVALNDILKKHVDVAEAEINSVLADKKNNDQLRKLPRPDLARHISDDIDSSVVDALTTAVSARVKISQDYYKLRAKLLKVKKLEYHERNIEYGELNKSYSFSQAAQLIDSVFSKLDPEFHEIFNRFITNGQVDIYPKKGKLSGAYSTASLITLPGYILLNHTDKLADVLTIAHEFGHSINDELIRDKQNALNFGTPLSTAEVASTFMEDFVLQEILKNADDKQRLAIMVLKLQDDISSIFRQVACYRFETELHLEFRKKGYLSKEEIGEIFLKHMGSYMGEAVELSPGSENWWVYWRHIRTYFYVYSYASGLLISKSLQAQVKKDPKFIIKVKEFLSTGTSDSPKNIFDKLGIDITDKKFWNQGLQEVEDLLEETTKLAKKLKKI